jgi:hypothetical protein
MISQHGVLLVEPEAVLIGGQINAFAEPFIGSVNARVFEFMRMKDYPDYVLLWGLRLVL